MPADRRAEVFVMTKTHLAFATSTLFSRVGLMSNQGLLKLIYFVILSTNHFVIKVMGLGQSSGF